MHVVDIVVVLVAAFVGGALNSVAGGGSFIALPALISAGVAPVSANATTAIALWPGSVASAIAYRRDLDQPRAVWVSLAIASLGGGVLGALLLLGTTNAAFLRLLPWLMLVASVTFTFGGRFARKREGAHGPSRAAIAGAFGLQLAIATYGGYFGGGMGIMMLAYFAAIGMTDIHAMNGLKSVLAVIINGVAIVAFVSAGAIAWTPGLIMIAGAVTGGWVGARLARRVPTARVKVFVTIVGWTMTAIFFARAYA